MAATIEEFPHHGDHLATDDRQAEMTIELLAAFVVLAALLVLLALVG